MKLRGNGVCVVAQWKSYCSSLYHRHGETNQVPHTQTLHVPQVTSGTHPSHHLQLTARCFAPCFLPLVHGPPSFTAYVPTLPRCHSTLLTSLELQGASAEKVVLVFTGHGHVMVGPSEFCRRSEGKVPLRVPQFFDSSVDLFRAHQNLTGSTCFLSTSKEVDICSSCLPVRLGAR